MLQTLLKLKNLQSITVHEEQKQTRGGKQKVICPSLQGLYLALLMVALIALFTPLLKPVRAGSGLASRSNGASSTENLPSLSEFRRNLPSGPENRVVGIYVPNVMAFEVVQQPAGNAAYVSGKPDVVTQFSLATAYETIGLLGHNYLAGKSFFEVKQSQKIYLIFGDGSIKTYITSKIDIFQALSPNSPYSSFRELSNPGVSLSVEEVFYRIYGSGDRLVLQTCVEADGLDSWGRIFVTALPVESNISYWNPHLIRQLEFE